MESNFTDEDIHGHIVTWQMAFVELRAQGCSLWIHMINILMCTRLPRKGCLNVEQTLQFHHRPGHHQGAVPFGHPGGDDVSSHFADGRHAEPQEPKGLRRDVLTLSPPRLTTLTV